MSLLIKHGDRTVRRGCSQCGSKELYWAHDTTPGAKVGKYACDKAGCAGIGSFNWTLINRDGSRHDCKGDGGSHSEPEVAETDSEATPSATPEPVPAFQPAPVPVAAPAPTATDPAMAAFQ